MPVRGNSVSPSSSYTLSGYQCAEFPHPDQFCGVSYNSVPFWNYVPPPDMPLSHRIIWGWLPTGEKLLKKRSCPFLREIYKGNLHLPGCLPLCLEKRRVVKCLEIFLTGEGSSCTPPPPCFIHLFLVTPQHWLPTSPSSSVSPWWVWHLEKLLSFPESFPCAQKGCI